MLKLITFAALQLTALLIMSHTKSPSANISQDLTKPLSHIINNCRESEISPCLITPGYYQLWRLDSAGLPETAFRDAIKGFNYLSKIKLITKKNIITIVDFSKPSTQKRLFVIDMSNGKILFNTWVAHGRNSGNEYATQFSNLPESHQTSLGFYVTMDTYKGGNGYSLRLKGCERGINDKAFKRAIVIHGADYVSGSFINNRGELGRSYGCPAIPNELSKNIIDLIKNGSCLFLYHPTKKYCTRSKILNSQV